MAQEAVGSSPITHPKKVLKYQDKRNSGCSVARLARLLWEQEVGGSNPLTPTILFRLIEADSPSKGGDFCFRSILFNHSQSYPFLGYLFMGYL